MRFQLFGVPITVRAFFWLTAVLLGIIDAAGPIWITLPLWVAIVFVSVLVHEFGHAFAVRRHGIAPAITLHGMGGTTSYSEWAPLGRWDRALISLAGPFAGLVVGGLVFAAARVLPPLPALAALAIRDLLWVNVAWSLLNLVPAFPFDGGHVVAELLGARRARVAAGVSLVVSLLLAAAFAWMREPWGTVMFVMSAMQSYQRYTLPEGAVLVDPNVTPAASTGPSALRRLWLRLRLKRLQTQADALRKDGSRRRVGGPDLRVIRGGADDKPKDKRYLN